MKKHPIDKIKFSDGNSKKKQKALDRYYSSALTEEITFCLFFQENKDGRFLVQTISIFNTYRNCKLGSQD